MKIGRDAGASTNFHDFVVGFKTFTFLLNSFIYKFVCTFFRLNMWVAVLLMLFITGAIFYGLATYYTTLQGYKKEYRKSAKGKLGEKLIGKLPSYIFVHC